MSKRCAIPISALGSESESINLKTVSWGLLSGVATLHSIGVHALPIPMSVLPMLAISTDTDMLTLLT